MASSNSELYFIAYLTSADSLCKISLNPSVSAECLNILVDNAYTKGIAYISQSLLFLMHKYSSSPNADKMIYSVVNFESYTEVWSMYSNCTTTTCNFDFGMPLVSQDRRIYVIHDTNPSQIFFVILDASSGSVQNTPYRSNICSTIFGLYLGEGNGRIYISVICSINYIVVWDNVLKIFSNFRITSTVNIYSIVYESYTQRVVFGGSNSSYLYMSKCSVNFALNLHPDISISSITSFISQNLNTVQTTSMSTGTTIIQIPEIITPTISNIPIELNIASGFKSDRYIVKETQDLGSINSNSEKSYSLNFTCSINGKTEISYSLVSDFSQSLPNWISLNSSTGILSIKSPNLSSAMSYQFYVNSTVSGTPTISYSQLIKILVEKGNSNTKKEATTEVKGCIYSSNAVMLIGAVSSFTTSLAASSSPQAIWMMANQLQMMMLLPLTKAFIPDDISNYFAGVSFINFNFDFIPITNSPVGIQLSTLLDNSNNADYLKNLGAPCKSCILNHLSLLVIILCLIGLHLVFLIPKLFIHKVKHRCVEFIYSKIMRMMTFTIYVNFRSLTSS